MGIGAALKAATVLLAVAPLAPLAQEAKSLEQIQQEDTLRRAITKIDEFQARLDVMMRDRETDCRKAIGYAPFCDCLMKELPIAWSFSDYIAITTRSREQNGYAKLDADHRAAYDKVAPIRDRCVRQINAKR